MAEIETLYQGLKDNNFHDDAIKKISELQNLDELILCAAFARSEGIELLLDLIDVDLDKVSFYIGVRNGITSAQSIALLLKNDIDVYCIDTGKGNILFHPKIYVSKNDSTGYGIVGSANLTLPVLTSNIETSLLIKFDLTNQSDQEAYNDLRNGITDLPRNHSSNSYKITNGRGIIRMLNDGVVIDERTPQMPNKPKTSNTQSSNTVSAINSHKKQINRSQKGKTKHEINKLKSKTTVTDQDWISVWKSNELTERDLNIPRGPNTNVTGSMLFKKGDTDGIDQRHYFRDVVFKDLTWTNDPNPNKSHLERASADFQIEVQGVNYGFFTLDLTHNSNTTSASYQQRNSMTQVHWGNVKSIIAKRELLGEKLKLYSNAKIDNKFKIEIG